jgi:adenosylcobinamide-phosphate synthase
VHEALIAILALITALTLDFRLGEPPTWIHPVVSIGHYLRFFGHRLTKLTPVAAFVCGTLAWMFGAITTAVIATVIEDQLKHWPWPFAALAIGVLLKPLFAWRMLRDEVLAVELELQQSLRAGQIRLQKIVSRDVNLLDEVQVRESAIESLSENLNDSLVAPLFWYCLGASGIFSSSLAISGLGAAALYRFANTADAMWGYRGRYEWAGKWAARADDVMSWPSARLTALLLYLTAKRRLSWRLLRSEARATPSPNGGWPMGAMAILLNVQLRKPGAYRLNAKGLPPQEMHTRQAVILAHGAVLWMAGLCCIFLIAAHLIGPHHLVMWMILRGHT